MTKATTPKPLSELEPGQRIVFLSPREENQYIKGTITTKAATPRSYYIEWPRQDISPYTPIHMHHQH